MANNLYLSMNITAQRAPRLFLIFSFHCFPLVERNEINPQFVHTNFQTGIIQDFQKVYNYEKTKNMADFFCFKNINEYLI